MRKVKRGAMRKVKFEIRKASLNDLEEIYRIGLLERGFAVSSETRFYGKDYLKNWLKNPRDSILLVGEKSGKIIGFCFINIMIKKWAMLENLIVIKKLRGKGVAAALLEESMKRLSQKGINYIGAWVRIENKSVIKFLKRYEFKTGYKFLWMERFKKPLWPEHKSDLVRLEKALKSKKKSNIS